MKSLYFEIIDDGNKIEDYEEMKELLEKHGVYLNWNIDDNTLQLSVNERRLNRGAGRRSKVSSVKDDTKEFGIRLIKLNDVLEMQKEMTEEELISKLNMSRATYYRHLKKAKVKKERNPDSDPVF